MTHANEEREALSPEALAYVKLFEGQISKGADVEDLMAKALAMQSRAAEKGEDGRATALGDAISYLESKYGLDSVQIAGDLAEASVSNMSGQEIFYSFGDQGTAFRANYRKAVKKRESSEVPRVQAIIDKVTRLYELTPDDLIGVNLPTTNTEARNLALYIASETTTLTFAELGSLFRGGGDNAALNSTFAINNSNIIKKVIGEPSIKEKVESVMSELGLETVERRPPVSQGLMI